MTLDWSALRQELALWRADGLTLPIWWRDDDAIAATPELERLARLSEDVNLPVHLAVIPKIAESSLSELLVQSSPFIPVVHGWAHCNMAPNDEKKAEFGHPRAGAAQELAMALAKMRALFGERLLPAFVAPWNRLHPAYNQLLADRDYRVVSTFLARATVHPVAGLLAVNTHIDPIDWRGSRSLMDASEIIANTVAQLRARRAGEHDNSEPFGYLTHHLVHTSDIWEFSRAFLSELQDGGAQSLPLATALEETS